MVAPRCGVPALRGRGAGQRFGSVCALAAKPFCSASAAASTSLSAQRLAEKLRAQKEAQKARGPVPADPVTRRVRELVRFTQQLQRVHPNVLAKALSRGIIHQDKNLVVINKPYGVPVHGGPGVRLCISDVLPILAKILRGHKADPLHLCHRLDKETTGVMVLAWENEVAHQVQELFRTRQVTKKYWAVTLRTPLPTAGVVDIPIVEKEVRGPQQHHKMTLSPSFRMDGDTLVRRRSGRGAHQAVTQYQVLSCGVSSALLELQPVTGIKHQLRVHLSFGLDCPILGDHKYSDWNRLVPQKLPAGTLKKLGLPQSKARHLPLHLHARQLLLPALGAHASPLSLVCKPPHFFTRSLRRLGLEPPSEELEGDGAAGPGGRQ